MRKNKRVEFNSPSGFPVAFGVELESKQKVNSDLHGVKAWKFAEEGHCRGQLSARATNRDITANTVHAIDAALCHMMVIRCAAVGASADKPRLFRYSACRRDVLAPGLAAGTALSTHA